MLNIFTSATLLTDTLCRKLVTEWCPTDAGSAGSQTLATKPSTSSRKSASGRAARRDSASRAKFVDATPVRHDFRCCSRRPLLRRAMSARSPPAPWLRADVSAKRFRGDADALSTRVLSCARGGSETVSRRRGRALDAGALARTCALPHSRFCRRARGRTAPCAAPPLRVVATQQSIGQVSFFLCFHSQTKTLLSPQLLDLTSHAARASAV